MKLYNIAMATLIAALSFTFASCSDLDIETPVSDATDSEIELVEGGDMPVTFNCCMADGDATRTEFHDETIWWSEGDVIKFYQRCIATAGGGYSTSYVTRTISEALKKYSTTINFSTPAQFPAYYYALYPSASVETPRTTIIGQTGCYTCITVPSEQNPSLVSFDRAADVLISEYVEADKKQTSFNMHFRRPVALGKMTIKNLPSASDIKSVRIENNRYYFAGEGLFGLDNDNFPGVSSGGGKNSITLNYTESVTADSADGMTAYFTCLPFTFAENESFTVTVTTAAGEVFTKKVTVPAGREIKFEADKGTRFNVDMSTAEKTCEFFSLGNSSSKTNTISDVYCRIAPNSSLSSTLSSVKYIVVAKDEYNPETNYIDETASAFSAADLTKINEGTPIVVSKSKCIIDKDYVFIVECTTSDGRTCQLTMTQRTDWFKLALVTRSLGGVQIQLTGIGLDPTKCKNYRIVATESLPASSSGYETYYTSTFNPGTVASTIEAINALDGANAVSLGVTKYYTDKSTQADMVSGTGYTAMMKVFNTRGESKFVYASANAK